MLNRKAWRFFFDNAGGVVGVRAVTAAKLARAEAEVLGSGDYRVRWDADDQPDLSWMDAAEAAEEHVVEVALLERRCSGCGEWHPVNVLGGIVDADEAYRRIVEAELACEAVQ